MNSFKSFFLFSSLFVVLAVWSKGCEKQAEEIGNRSYTYNKYSPIPLIIF